MMVSTEEKDLKKIREDFTSAIKLLKSDKLNEAKDAFAKIVNNNKESGYTSIMQVQMRSNVYKQFIEFKLDSENKMPENDEDFLNEGLLMLNDGKLEKAESYFNVLINKNYSTPFFHYLLALLNMKKGETELTLDYLRKSFELDETLKNYAYNESDFGALKDNEEFMSLIS